MEVAFFISVTVEFDWTLTGVGAGAGAAGAATSVTFFAVWDTEMFAAETKLEVVFVSTVTLVYLVAFAC